MLECLRQAQLESDAGLITGPTCTRTVLAVRSVVLRNAAAPAVELVEATEQAVNFGLCVRPSALRAGGDRIVACASWSELLDRLQDCEPIAVAYTAGLHPGHTLGAAARAFRSRGLRCPIAAFVPSDRLAITDASRLLELPNDVTLVVQGQASLSRALIGIAAPPYRRTATAALVRAVRDRVPERCRLPVVAALVLAQRRTSVRQLAAALGTSERTLRHIFAREQLPTTRRLLGLSTCLYGAWHIDVLGLSVNETAKTLGFATSKDYSSFARSNSGTSPGKIKMAGGFDQMFRTFVELLGPARVLRATALHVCLRDQVEGGRS